MLHLTVDVGFTDFTNFFPLFVHFYRKNNFVNLYRHFIISLHLLCNLLEANVQTIRHSRDPLNVGHELIE